jgi:5-formyltetrahydrofolate cyclo-ligase
LRAAALTRRRAYVATLGADARREAEDRLATIICPHVSGSTIVAAYHPMRDELSPHAIVERLDPGTRVALPWFAGRDAPMQFREGPAMELGPWKLLQPAPNADILSPDLLLVPLVLADRDGTRIGQGKGHYDRALAALRTAGPIRTIGIAWDVQIADAPIPPDPWDVPLDAIATPTRWIDCG